MHLQIPLAIAAAVRSIIMLGCAASDQHDSCQSCIAFFHRLCSGLVVIRQGIFQGAAWLVAIVSVHLIGTQRSEICEPG